MTKRQERRAPPMGDSEDDLLDAILKKHGAILSHHRMMAASEPEVLRAYDSLYTKLTLDPRVLSATDRQLLWISLTAATQERYGAFHIKIGEKIGLSEEAVADAITIAAAVEVYSILDEFAAVQWADVERPILIQNRYLAIFEQSRGNMKPPTSELCAAVCHAARNRLAAMVLHIDRFFRAGGKRGELEEALSYLLFHCGAPFFVHAVDAWADAAKEGDLPAPYPPDREAK